MQRPVRGPLQAAEPRRGSGGRRNGAALLAAGLVAWRLACADDPVPLEAPSAAAPESAMTAAGAASTEGSAGGGPAPPAPSPHRGAAPAAPRPFLSPPPAPPPRTPSPPN